jgi:hypothetical protein
VALVDRHAEQHDLEPELLRFGHAFAQVLVAGHQVGAGDGALAGQREQVVVDEHVDALLLARLVEPPQADLDVGEARDPVVFVGGRAAGGGVVPVRPQARDPAAVAVDAVGDALGQAAVVAGQLVPVRRAEHVQGGGGEQPPRVHEHGGPIHRRSPSRGPDRAVSAPDDDVYSHHQH